MLTKIRSYFKKFYSYFFYTPTEKYPKELLRGISNPAILNLDPPRTPMLSQELFTFQEHTVRTDGWIRESINWEDNA